jgi:hypothetical protein
MQTELKHWIKSTPVWDRLLGPVHGARAVDKWLVGRQPVPPCALSLDMEPC